MRNKSAEAFEVIAEASKAMAGGGALCVSITACNDAEKKELNVNFGANGSEADITNMLINVFTQIMNKPEEPMAKVTALAIALSNDTAVKFLLSTNNQQEENNDYDKNRT